MIENLKYRVASMVKKSPKTYDLFLRVKRSGAKERCLKAYSAMKGDSVSFLQIGANDGLWYDPIRYFAVWKKWTGLLCEPIAESYSALKYNYAHVNNAALEFRQVAVSVGGSAKLELFRMDAEWLGRLPEDRKMSLLRKTSFDRNHLLQFISEDESAYVRSDSVPAMSLEALWKCCSIESACPEVLVMDLEGLEAALLTSQDFVAFHPELILLEHAHMSTEHKNKVSDKLSEAGYTCFEFYPDSVAIDRDIASEMSNV